MWYKSLPTIKMSWNEWKDKLKTAFPTKRDFHTELIKMTTRKKRSGESYERYFYEKLTMVTACKIVGSDAMSCLIRGIDDVVVKTGARAGNHQTPESLYTYLASLGDKISPAPRPSSKPTAGRFQYKYKDDQNKRPMQCYQCGKYGHTKYKCDKAIRAKRVVCSFCKCDGHVEANCFKKNKVSS